MKMKTQEGGEGILLYIMMRSQNCALDDDDDRGYNDDDNHSHYDRNG